MSSGFILKVESVRFVDGLDGGMRERKELRTLPGFGLSNWKEIISVLSCSDSCISPLAPLFKLPFIAEIVDTYFAAKARRKKFHALLFHIPSSWPCSLLLLLTSQCHPSLSRGFPASSHRALHAPALGLLWDPCRTS